MPTIVKSKISSKQKRVIGITDMLSKGMERKEILQKLAKTCKVSNRTIDNEIKEAKTIIAERNKETEVIRLSVTKQMTEEAIKEGLKSDLELEVILCQIASGNIEVQEWIKGEAVLRSVSPMEVINATKTIFAKRGSNAPEKSEVKIDSAPFNDSQVEKILHEIKTNRR